MNNIVNNDEQYCSRFCQFVLMKTLFFIITVLRTTIYNIFARIQNRAGAAAWVRFRCSAIGNQCTAAAAGMLR
jgi:hypothetical protein